jgi:hypothetical protein
MFQKINAQFPCQSRRFDIAHGRHGILAAHGTIPRQKIQNTRQHLSHFLCHGGVAASTSASTYGWCRLFDSFSGTLGPHSCGTVGRGRRVVSLLLERGLGQDIQHGMKDGRSRFLKVISLFLFLLLLLLSSLPQDGSSIPIGQENPKINGRINRLRRRSRHENRRTQVRALVVKHQIGSRILNGQSGGSCSFHRHLGGDARLFITREFVSWSTTTTAHLDTGRRRR